MNRWKAYKAAGVIALSACLLSGCKVMMQEIPEETGMQAEAEQGGVVQKAEEKDINDVHLRDKDLLYANDDDTSVVTMYLTVTRGNDAENTNHSWEEINTYSAYDYAEWGVPRYQTAALLQVGDENGPVPGEVGYDESVPNATVQIRGQTSSRNAQKNYKIELKKNKGTWRGQRTINLNKHMSDGLRFRNKMAYDLIEEIPQIMGLRTQFVHLYVKDDTGETPGEFEDYGLYTQVEQLNKTGLKAHGLDSNGQLYKINFFEFFRYEDVIKPADDPEYNLTEFEKLLEVKGDTDHTKLIEMLEAVNDYSISINQILDKYFDRENLQWWMAFQILIGNADTESRNMYLYSPQNSSTWYIIPWDHDKAFSNSEYELEGFQDRGSWQTGISNYWGNVLFQRCLKSDSFREELDSVIRELKEFLNEERLENMVEMYSQMVKPYVYQMPDAMHIDLSEEEYEQIAEAVPEEVEENYEQYLESLEKPMPFYTGVPEIDDEGLKLIWDPSYDFDAENITYTVELAKDYLFQQVIYRQEDVVIPEVITEVPEPGQYFVRVRAENESGQVQDTFDYYVTDTGKQYGMKCFYITADGTVEEDVYVE